MADIKSQIMADIDTSLSKKSTKQERRKAIEERLNHKIEPVIPARGQLKLNDRITLFIDMAEKVQASVSRVKNYTDIPEDVATYLRSHNLPSSIRTGQDKRLGKAKWQNHKNIEITKGASDGNDLVGISHAEAAIAESGTLLLSSGQNNPTSINFLADHHIVVIDAKDIKGHMEASWAYLKNDDGDIDMPRVANFITGPSRSADIEQKLLLGAHGPRALHIIIVG